MTEGRGRERKPTKWGSQPAEVSLEETEQDSRETGMVVKESSQSPPRCLPTPG